MNSLYLIQILLLSICSLISSVPIQKEGETVIGLFMVTLNTARSPGKYLKDDRNIEFWEKYGGFSQQTALGKEQIVDIGKFLKNYYKDFLTEKYHPKNVYVRSIDTDRSLSSAQALIYGMYPDVVSQSTDQQWSSQSDWVPKPIHTHSKPLDPIFTVTAQSCPAYDVIKEESMNSEAYLAVENSKKDFMKEVAIYSGFEIKRYIDIWDVSENILCQIHHGLTLDQFSTDNLDEIKDAFFYTSNFLYAETHEKSKLIAGPLLNDMVDRINDKLNGKTTHQVTVYSLGGAHGQFYGLIGLLGLAEIPARPFLGSTYIFELLKVNSSTFIRVMFRTNDVGQPITINPVNIKGCEEYCPLNKFNQIVQDKIVKDTTAACAIGGNNNSIKNNPSIFFLVLSVFLTSAFKQF